MTEVIVKPHQIYCPAWGWLDSPASGQRATVVSITGPFAVVKLQGNAHYYTRLEHLEPAA